GPGATGPAHGAPFGPELIPAFSAKDVWVHGAFALEQGFIFVSMVLSAVVVYIIERDFRRGALWCLVAATLASVGLMHSYAWTSSDTVIDMHPGWPWLNPWALGYLAIAAVLLLARWTTVTREGDALH